MDYTPSIQAATTFRALALPVLALVVVAVYVALILVSPHLGPIDDHELLATLQIGKALPPFVTPEIGRFYPLDGQVLNLVAYVSTEPSAYYAVNAVELVLLAALFFDQSRRIAGRGPTIVALLLLLLSPGFVTAWFRLLVPERESLLFFVGFFWCYRRFASSRRMLSAVGALGAANLALYFKEPGFVMLGGFALVRLVTQAAEDTKKTRSLDLFLLASAVLFVAIYYFAVYRYRGPSLYGLPVQSPWLEAAKVGFSYALGDPILVFLAIPLSALRVWRIASRRAERPTLADAALAGALAYMAVFLVLDMYAPHYWLPAYAFAFPAVLDAWPRRAEHLLLWRIGGSLAVFLIVTVTLPSALYLASYYKYVPRNFTALLPVLEDAIERTPPPTRARIYLDGIVRPEGSEIFAGLQRYLAAAGVDPSRLELLPGRAPTDSTRGDWRPARPGDYLLLTPFATNEHDEAFERGLAADYRLIWRSSSPYALPNLQLRVLLKYLALRYLFAGGDDIRLSRNFSYSVDYALYAKR